MDDIILDCDDSFLKKKRHEKMLSELDELDMEDGPIGISDNRPKKEKKKSKKEEEKRDEEAQENDWLETVANFQIEPIKRKHRKPVDIFEFGEGKKKKKKKKKDGELTDYSKEFENEMTLIKGLMQDQSKFTDSLQRKYDAMENTKSSARGIGKFTTDLIESINTSRNISLQLIKEQANLKKTIADLTMKEKKEFGSGAGKDDDIGLLSSSMLKQMINESTQSNSGGDFSISDAEMDDVFDDISEQLGRTEEDDEIDKYLKYESANVTVYACVNDGDGENYFIAKDDNGNVIEDYPLPEMTQLSINRSTDVASDVYSRKYPIIWVG